MSRERAPRSAGERVLSTTSCSGRNAGRSCLDRLAARARGPSALPGVVLALCTLALPSTRDLRGDIPRSARGQARGAAGPVVPSPSAGAWIEREAYAMGTLLRIRVEAPDRPAAVRASEAALAAVQETEDLLSTWRPGTALARLNGVRAGLQAPVPRPLLELLEEAFAWSRATGGAFDPAVGALIDAWNLRGEGRVPSATELEDALASTGVGCLALDVPRERLARSCRDAWIDAGAFGKGAALRRARSALLAAGARSARLDFGGQLLLVGSSPGATGWTVRVAHPSRRGHATRRLRVDGGSVATTGQSERGVATPDGRAGHVLDPRTGRPVPAWGSVTVVGEDPLAADVLSTALYVMGPEAGLAWLERRPEIAALFLVEEPGGLSIRATGAMRALLRDPLPAAERSPPASPGADRAPDRRASAGPIDSVHDTYRTRENTC